MREFTQAERPCRAATPVSWTGYLVVLGWCLRLYHYGRNPSMWHDEAALVLNVLGKGFAELLGPLFFAEAAPPMFLWLEKAVTLLLGDGTYALRLPALLASCLALLLLVPVARRVLQPAAVPWAILLFACSDHLLWHACEAKPYSVDVLVAVTLLTLVLGLESRPLAQQLVIYALLAPPILLLAYPGCFLFGGLLVALLPRVCRARQARTWLGYALLVLAVFVTFALVLSGPVRAQRCADMEACWVKAFAPWDKPWQVPIWTFLSTLELFRYCCEPAGAGLAGLGVAGALCLWRGGQRALVAFLVVPIGLAYLASCVKAYPYGGTRVLVYAAPAVVLFIAASMPPLLDWLRSRSRLATALVHLFVLLPLGFSLCRVVVHWNRADCASAAAYVLAQRQPTDLVTSTSWESLYYFRHLGEAFRDARDLAGQSASRIWFVVGDSDPRERVKMAEALMPPDYRPVDRCDFSRTTVFLLTRQEP